MLIKLQAWPATLFKIGSNTGVFLFLQKTSGGGLKWSIKSFNFTNIPDVYCEDYSAILNIF